MSPLNHRQCNLEADPHGQAPISWSCDCQSQSSLSIDDGRRAGTYAVSKAALLLLAFSLVSTCPQAHAFAISATKHGLTPRLQSVLWAATSEKESLSSQEDSVSANNESMDMSSNMVSDWTTASSFGSFLLKRQKAEQEEMRHIGVNETSLLLEQIAPNVTEQPPPPTPSEQSRLDMEAARELDDAVTRVVAAEPEKKVVIKRTSIIRRLLGRKRKVDEAREQEKAAADALNMPLSMPEHYRDRIGRDMRHLAVSIASNINAPWQYRLFCEEKGGIVPLLQCVHEGARYIRERSVELDESEFWGFTEESEESLMAAVTACRALRDLCALSPELSAVVTDGILQVDAVWAAENPTGGVLSDFVTLLSHANDSERICNRIYKRQERLRGTYMARPSGRRNKGEASRRCKLYVLQLLLAMSVASDEAVKNLRSTPGLTEAVLACSSYARKEQTRRWLRYPIEVVKRWTQSRSAARLDNKGKRRRRPFIEAAAVGDDLTGVLHGTANQVLAAIGYNQWVPKIPGQKGLRILCIDGGGSRGMAAVTTLNKLVESMGGVEVCDSFDIIAGTSTGAIIAFLVGLRRESVKQAKERYNELIKRIFVKSALSTPMLLFTTATYDEVHFSEILQGILGDYSMLDSRADPAVPLVCAVSSKMSSTPTHVALFRNYNYANGELPDTFTVDPEEARVELGLPVEDDIAASSISVQDEDMAWMPGQKRDEASRHPGSFRVLQRVALRASTAAPTVFKPVFMGGEIYCDGGIVASNPASVAIHEARTVFPDVPIEMVVSVGTGGFIEEKRTPRIGWDGIIDQIVNSATDAEQIHHILEDVLGQDGTAQLGQGSISKTRYYRLNPLIGTPNDFPIDVTDDKQLEDLTRITELYLEEPEQQRKLQEIGDILEGRKRWWRW